MIDEEKKNIILEQPIKKKAISRMDKENNWLFSMGDFKKGSFFMMDEKRIR